MCPPTHSPLTIIVLSRAIMQRDRPVERTWSLLRVGLPVEGTVVVEGASRHRTTRPPGRACRPRHEWGGCPGRAKSGCGARRPNIVAPSSASRGRRLLELSGSATANDESARGGFEGEGLYGRWQRVFEAELLAGSANRERAGPRGAGVCGGDASDLAELPARS